MAPSTIVLGVTGCREVGAFYLSSLAGAFGVSVESFLMSVKDNECLLVEAKQNAEPIKRMEICRGGDEEVCFKNLLLEYPGAVREEILLS